MNVLALQPIADRRRWLATAPAKELGDSARCLTTCHQPCLAARLSLEMDQ